MYGMTTPSTVGAIRFLPVGRDGRVDVELPPAARDACVATAHLYERNGYSPPWVAYLALADGAVAGICSFKSPPAEDRVEIAYFTFPGHEGRGIATAMACELVRIAHTRQPDLLLLAQTLPEENASTAILRRLGFAYAGTTRDDDAGEVWEWHLHPGFRLR